MTLNTCPNCCTMITILNDVIHTSKPGEANYIWASCGCSDEWKLHEGGNGHFDDAKHPTLTAETDTDDFC